MRRWTGRLIILGVVVVLAVVIYRWLFPSPALVIKKNLSAIAKLATFGANEAPLAKLSNTQQLMSYFSEDTVLNFEAPGRGMETINGRDSLRQAVMTARSQVTSLTVELLDPQVSVDSSGNQATVDLTAKANIAGDRDPYVQEMLFTFRRINRDWLITRIEPVKTLR